MMKNLLAIAVISCLLASVQAQDVPAPAKSASDIAGTWLGAIDTGALKLRVAFNISGADDALTATMDSLDQGVRGFPMTSAKRQGFTLTLEVARLAGAYKGNIAPDLQTISGTWTQGGASFPLLLKRVKDLAEVQPRRPQMPSKPYPYKEEDVSYDNASAKVTLAATLTIPEGKGPFPAVLLITGSGPQDRDESLMGHKPFLVLADYLTRKGIAVLRADDRGVGKSTGTFATSTTADFATDAEAGVAYLASRTEVDKRRIGLIGHSEGGVIAPMVAARNPQVAFIVLLAGTGVPGDQLLIAQVSAIAAAAGAAPEQVAAAADKERELLEMVKAEPDNAALAERMAGKATEAQVSIQIKAVTTPWFRYFLTYDPATALRKVSCPVLALNGEKDTQVPPQQNLPAIRKALSEGGDKHFETVMLPGLNHLFQTARTGALSEYGTIEETMSPVALEKIATWILAQSPASAPAGRAGH
jgi:pimeloyl-ACP methyl ester carboxylesterase